MNKLMYNTLKPFVLLELNIHNERRNFRNKVIEEKFSKTKV